MYLFENAFIYFFIWFILTVKKPLLYGDLFLLWGYISKYMYLFISQFWEKVRIASYKIRIVKTNMQFWPKKKIARNKLRIHSSHSTDFSFPPRNFYFLFHYFDFYLTFWTLKLVCLWLKYSCILVVNSHFNCHLKQNLFKCIFETLFLL